jgi:hypothetical protein
MANIPGYAAHALQLAANLKAFLHQHQPLLLQHAELLRTLAATNDHAEVYEPVAAFWWLLLRGLGGRQGRTAPKRGHCTTAEADR